MVDAATDPQPISSEELAILWARACTDECSPDNFEMSEHGEVLWVPPRSNRRQAISAWICNTLTGQIGGSAVGQLAVLTADAGVRVPAIAWLPSDRVDEALAEGPLWTCPPLIVEICLSTFEELAVRRKVSAYLRSGTSEVIVVGPSGEVRRHENAALRESISSLSLRIPKNMFRAQT
jgi:Uma2 family endonuclease